MRHELRLGEWIVTSDNSGGIGEKPLDFVKAPDKVTAKFAARVALLEQWAAQSEPEAVLLHNFSGEAQWNRYVEGIEELLFEAGIKNIQLTGSSETNVETLQSAIGVTMLGKRQREENSEPLKWFVYGMPLVGKDVLEKKEQLADIKKINEARLNRLVERLWPVGSKGIAKEAELLFGKQITPVADVDVHASAGPSTCVLIGVREENTEALKGHFGIHIYPLHH
ncbi:alpha-ribazole-5-phosphate synthase [Planococcus sp. N028]|uniref:Alpha-ribazole-5-phosphate synthase n=1 Tax=Planococcus shixiaomingii TaxID=3058393 RepID=A0ABT8N1R3_9BACL|nr:MULTISPECIES: alpha-ribazole-5-phosphate synthase [unclassified Planococcus (in: firmicutes)]MDN7241818.1 alpha-ribazole-5-phosphate synthase [Planococcus sp. N028]WKA54103.1 alpha-ribazole-5-phosphate synthase [Planococcus sp. N022]